MENELKCSHCNYFFCNPVLLPCFHSLCYTCALHLQENFNNNNLTNIIIKSTNYSNQTNNLTNLNTTSTLTSFSSHASSPIQINTSLSPQSSISSSSSTNIDICRTLSITDLGSSITSDLDKLSIFSETDSGVAVGTSNQTTISNSACSSSSLIRPYSYIGRLIDSSSRDHSFLSSKTSLDKQKQAISNFSFTQLVSPVSLAPPPLPTSSLYSTFLQCPECNRMIYMDETGVESLTKNTCLEKIVDRYIDSKKISIKCQMCIENGIKEASIMCEQCEIFYCEQCRETCHPMRGPLAKHILLLPKLGQDLIKKKNRAKESKCIDHLNESVGLYCLLCKSSCCNLCVSESSHINHKTQPINLFCKSQKAELSQILQSLSEKAKTSTEYLTKLKTLPELIEENSNQLKTVLVNEIDEIIGLLELKKKELFEFIDTEKVSKINRAKEQASIISNKIQKTTGLLQFCVETLKEQDPSSFLQISENLINRISEIEQKFPQDSDLKSSIDLEFDFTLNSDSIIKEIKKLNYKQIKVPSSPRFVTEDCYNTSNEPMIILSWNQKSGIKSNAQGYVLEIDDGTLESTFKQVYCGSDKICQINGLAPNCVYNARVKAFNQAGFSEYSHILSIPATPTLWFSLNPKTSHNDIMFSNNFMTATCMSLEDRVILGSVGFSKGIHYWEVSIDRYDNQPDPCFGIAHYDVAKEYMLGKDTKSWSMYIDSKRSWFMHNGKHISRIDNGIQQKCVIGILLDMNNHALKFYVNDEQQGGTAFNKLPQGVYYPAFSLNKNVQITLSSGLEPPACLVNSDSFSD